MTGSRKFLRLIKEKYDEALDIARQQEEMAKTD
jgi:cobalamin-dependent methionine synthase I